MTGKSNQQGEANKGLALCFLGSQAMNPCVMWSVSEANVASTDL